MKIESIEQLKEVLKALQDKSICNLLTDDKDCNKCFCQTEDKNCILSIFCEGMLNEIGNK